MTAPPAQLTATHSIGTFALFKWISGYARRRWFDMLIVLGAMVARIALDLLKPWPTKILVDFALSHHPTPPWLTRTVALLPATGEPYHLLYLAVSATVIFFLLSWILGAVSAMANVSFGQHIAFDLAADVFAHLQRLSLRFHHRQPVGDLIRRVTSDSGAVTAIIKDALLPAVSAAVMLAAMFTVLWRLNAPLALVSLVIVPIMVLAFRKYSDPMLQASYRQQEADGRIYTAVEQTLAAIPVVQAFGLENDSDQRLKQCTSESLTAARGAMRVNLKFKVLTGFATAIGTSLVLWLGARQAMDGQISVGDLLVFLSYLSSIYGPLETLAYTSLTTQGAAGSARRVLEILQVAPEILEKPNALPMTRARGEVVIESVTFGYDISRPILHNVTIKTHPGETIALVGPTGAGKSTLVGLIPRFIDPWSGSVTLDGIDVRDLRLRDLRRQIAVVLQEPLLFARTVAENIAYGCPSASREEIHAAAVAANADEFVRRLPDGYETLVGPRGATLSGGERQRLSIARALLTNAPILILDEPTSALDAETEHLLLGALRRLMVGRTTFIIGHRLATVRSADRIIVIEAGKVTEQGRHEELLRSGGIYSRMHSTLFSTSPPVIASSVANHYVQGLKGEIK